MVFAMIICGNIGNVLLLQKYQCLHTIVMLLVLLLIINCCLLNVHDVSDTVLKYLMVCSFLKTTL
jgi:hypothetical protein